MAEQELNAQQELFCREYMKDLNATQAAIRAGYSEKTARQIGSENLSKPYIRERIDHLAGRRLKLVDLTAENILIEMGRLAKADIRDFYDENGNLRPIHEIPEDARRAISGVDVEELFAGRGDDRDHIGRSKKIRLWDKTKALEMLGKYHKLLTDRQEVSVDSSLAARLDKILAEMEAARKKA